jgi:hypothetical protein
MAGAIMASGKMLGFLRQPNLRGLVRLDVKAVELRVEQTAHRQTLWIVGSISTIIAAIRLMDWFLANISH